MGLSKMFMVSENLWHKTETQHTERRNYIKSCYNSENLPIRNSTIITHFTHRVNTVLVFSGATN